LDCMDCCFCVFLCLCVTYRVHKPSTCDGIQNVLMNFDNQVKWKKNKVFRISHLERKWYICLLRCSYSHYFCASCCETFRVPHLLSSQSYTNLKEGSYYKEKIMCPCIKSRRVHFRYGDCHHIFLSTGL
jgi:hypothetical protein